MAVGVIGEENPRYFSIVRWGDAKLAGAGKKETVGREMAALVDCDRGNRFSHCNVGCHALWRIEIRLCPYSP